MMKLVSTLVICTSLTISPLAAQTIPYNPAVRAAPPVFKPIPPKAPTVQKEDTSLTAAAIIAGIAVLAYIATRTRPVASDDRPTNWTGRTPPKAIEFYEERASAPIPTPPPAPAISPFYDVSKGVGG